MRKVIHEGQGLIKEMPNPALAKMKKLPRHSRLRGNDDKHVANYAIFNS
jgi:hypothetical protein